MHSENLKIAKAAVHATYRAQNTIGTETPLGVSQLGKKGPTIYPNPMQSLLLDDDIALRTARPRHSERNHIPFYLPEAHTNLSRGNCVCCTTPTVTAWRVTVPHSSAGRHIPRFRTLSCAPGLCLLHEFLRSWTTTFKYRHLCLARVDKYGKDSEATSE